MANSTHIGSPKSMQALLLFFVWPVAGLAYALWSRLEISRMLVWFFCGFYGLTFVLVDDSIDADRYRDALQVWHMRTDVDIFQFIGFLVQGRFGYTDFVMPLTTYLVSRVTDHYTVLFACFGLIFGWFYAQNLSFFLRQYQGTRRFWFTVLLINLAVIIGFWEINGFRFWTASQIFIYGILQHISGHRKKAWIFVLLAVGCHISFGAVALIFGLYRLIGTRFWLVLPLFVLGLFSTLSFEPSTLIGIVEYLPENVQRKFFSYTYEGYEELIQAQSSQLVWYVKYFRTAFAYLLLALVTLYIYRHFSKIKEDPQLWSYLNFLLYLGAFAAVAMVFPSGGRFFVVFSWLLCGFAILCMLRFPLRPLHQTILGLGIPIFILHLVVSIRLGAATINAFIFVLNPLIAWYFDHQLPLKTILGF